MSAYVVECDRLMKNATVERIALAMDLFKRFMKELGLTRVADLSRDRMREFNLWLGLPRTSRHGKAARSPETVTKNTAIVQRMWQWVYDEDKTGRVPPPKFIKLVYAAGAVVTAPTWAEMDACIDACETEWHRQLATVMRFTGLRVNQAMRLLWSDVDVEGARLTVRGELGKTKQEMRGRVVPLSLHFTKILATWGKREGFLVKSNRRGERERVARARDMARAWARAGVRAAAWESSPNHSFRDGFISGLKRMGADDEAVEVLVGHSLGLRGRYVDADALPLEAAVALIPAMKADNVTALKARAT